SAPAGGDAVGPLNTANIYVPLKPIDERERDQFVLMDEVRNNILPKVSPEGVRTSLQEPGLAGGGGGGGGEGGAVARDRATCISSCRDRASPSSSARATPWRNQQSKSPGWSTSTPH